MKAFIYLKSMPISSRFQHRCDQHESKDFVALHQKIKISLFCLYVAKIIQCSKKNTQKRMIHRRKYDVIKEFKKTKQNT